MQTREQRNQIDFPYAIRSFIGYLEGTSKSSHTIKNYQLDLMAFRDFVLQEYQGKAIRLDQLSRKDIENYRDSLKEKGLKTNTRRRKILTVSKFLSYLAKRKKLSSEMAQKFVAPHKIERIPETFSIPSLIETIRQLPRETVLEVRNRALLWTLAETGCLVSEVTRLKFEDWQKEEPSVQIAGKVSRTVPVSIDLLLEIQALAKLSDERPWLFLGFNKFGSLGSPISSRGVEILVKFYADRLGVPHLTPRFFRHSAVVHWFETGLSRSEIQTRLGLKTAYAFRSYEPLFKSRSEATSTSETLLKEF